MFTALLIEKGEDGSDGRAHKSGRDGTSRRRCQIDVEYSTLNYKDGLAITGKSPVVRKFPMVPGIDLAGSVTESSPPTGRRRPGSPQRLGRRRNPLGRLGPAPSSTATGWSRCRPSSPRGRPWRSGRPATPPASA